MNLGGYSKYGWFLGKNYIVVEFMQIISVITINESLMNINERL